MVKEESPMKLERSLALFEEAKKYMPGGVNSPVRAFSAVGMNPPFIKEGRGAYLMDEDGNRYIDYVLSWGPLILGHCHPQVVEALKETLEKGTSFGAPTALETQMAQLVTQLVPSVEMIRMVNSGTEATMSALRLARGYTGRSKIVKFAGNYHGHSDALLIKAGSGALTHGVPSSPGVPQEVASNTITAPFNHIEALEAIFEAQGHEIAGVIVEPVAGNMGVVPMTQQFAQRLRELTTAYGSVLIFDEVMTGFRVALGGAQSLYGITPDLTCFGKIIGGGLPVGAFGGKGEIMEMLSPLGPVYQAGTLSGNPLAMTAGLTTLTLLKEHPEIYVDLDRRAQRLVDGLQQQTQEFGIPASFHRVGSMACMFFTPEVVRDFETALTADTQQYALFFREMLARGVYLAPSQFEALFLSSAHGDEEIEYTLTQSREALKVLVAQMGQKGSN